MGGYEQALRIEAEGLPDIIRFVQLVADSGKFILTAKGRLALEFQRRFGDIIFNCQGRFYAAEAKIEEVNRHGNFFLETWSNRQRRKQGWLFDSEADLLFYYFRASGELYVIPFPKLARWAFGAGEGQGAIWAYPERRQSKYHQKNDTWGRCVPIRVVVRATGATRYVTEGAEFFREPLAETADPSPR